MDDLRGHLTPKVVHSSPDLPRPGQTNRWRAHTLAVTLTGAAAQIVNCAAALVSQNGVGEDLGPLTGAQW